MKKSSDVSALRQPHDRCEIQTGPEKSQKSGTEENIHPTLQVSEGWHVNTAEKTCNRGRDEQGPAKFKMNHKRARLHKEQRY